MRALIGLILGVLLPGLSCAEIIQYTFTGRIANDPANPSPIPWNGPGPEPTTFQMTFDVNTLNPSNSVSETFGSCAPGATLCSINASLPATDFSLIVDGKLVSQSPTASFLFGGTPLGPTSTSGGTFIGGPFGAGTNSVGFSGVPDFYLPVATQAQLLASNDPLGLMLNGSQFNTDDYTLFNFDGYSLESYVLGEGTLVGPTPVPEPGVLSLLLLGALGLGIVHRPRKSLAAAGPG